MGRGVGLVNSALLTLSLLLGGEPALGAGERVPLPTFPEGKGDQCVEPTTVMRRDHMRFLKHQRDDTMHRGIRTKRHSLRECIDCHVQRDTAGKTIPINASGQFCQSCHAFAAVKMDCFQCHATTPDSGAPAQPARQHSGVPVRGPDTPAPSKPSMLDRRLASQQHAPSPEIR